MNDKLIVQISELIVSRKKTLENLTKTIKKNCKTVIIKAIRNALFITQFEPKHVKRKSVFPMCGVYGAYF